MTNRVDKFEESRALESIATDERVEAHREEYIARYLELMEEPEERNDLILRNLILELFEADGEETGNWDAAESYWESVGDLATLSHAELLTAPIMDRGTVWSDAEALMSLWAKEQAFIEIFAMEELESSIRSGADIIDQARNFTSSELKDLSDGSIDIKARKDRIKAGQTNGTGS
jgi:hypothetical protein